LTCDAVQSFGLLTHKSRNGASCQYAISISAFL